MEPIKLLEKLTELCQDKEGMKGTMVLVVHHPMTITKKQDDARHEDTKSSIVSFGVLTQPQMKITIVIITEWLAGFMRKVLGINVSSKKEIFSNMRRFDKRHDTERRDE